MFVSIIVFLLVIARHCQALRTSSRLGVVRRRTKPSFLPLKAEILTYGFDETLSSQMSEPCAPGKVAVPIMGMWLNLWGVMYGISIFGTGLFALPLMVVLTFVSDIIGQKKQRRLLDWFIHYWARFAMFLLGTKCTLYGAENLPSPSDPVVYVPNHTSFMDILALSGYIPRPFKYLSKAEIMYIPFIGLGMKLALHVFLERNNVKSAFEVTDHVVEHLKNGNSVVVFAEGTRSRDGKLKAFKKGAFEMAKRAGVKIVPVSLGNVHRWMPENAALPLGRMRHVYVKVHPQIEVTPDTKISVLRKECFAAVNSGLPPFQQFVEEEERDSGA